MSNDFFQRKNATKGQQKAVVIDFKLALYGTQNIPSIMSERSVRSIEVRCIKCFFVNHTILILRSGAKKYQNLDENFIQ